MKFAKHYAKAASFEVGACQDPYCGPHIFAMDDNGCCIAEIVIRAEAVESVCEALREIVKDHGARKVEKSGAVN